MQSGAGLAPKKFMARQASDLRLRSFLGSVPDSCFELCKHIQFVPFSPSSCAPTLSQGSQLNRDGVVHIEQHVSVSVFPAYQSSFTMRMQGDCVWVGGDCVQVVRGEVLFEVLFEQAM
jgi:hypothetical protein